MLETIWFVLWGLLWAIYFILDGYDLGLGITMPLVATDDREIKTAHYTIGPFWDGNEVWLITAGGVTFAAFPTTYAIMFSTLYSPLLLILFALIIRAVSYEFRHQLDDPRWKKMWDVCFVGSSFAASLLFGVAFANIFQGVPFDDKGAFHGSILTLLNPYGLVGGLLFVIMFAVHGLLWLAVKTEGKLHERAADTASKLWIAELVVAVVFLAHTWVATSLYNNYLNTPILFIIPLLAVVSLLGIRVLIAKQQWWKAWFSSCLFILTAVLFGVIGLFPDLYPSSLDPLFSQTAFNSASSPLTLKIMLIAAGIFVPIVIAYQVWANYLFKHKVTDEILDSHYGY